jgi:hypothetical protein
MRHVTLTCKHHPQLRWTCKSIAFTPGQGYNQLRHIFFHGARQGEPDSPMQPANECPCSAADLVLAPEDHWSSLSIEMQKAAIKEDVA